MATYVRRFTPSAPVSAGALRMAKVEVFTESGALAGSYCWGRNPRPEEIEDMAAEIVREREGRLAA